jgi:hypothetical protein
MQQLLTVLRWASGSAPRRLGEFGHTVANLAAVEGIPQDGPVFLRS